jgi:hypothetical protein
MAGETACPIRSSTTALETAAPPSDEGSLAPSDNEGMTEKELTRRWAQTWKDAGPELEKIRLHEARDEDITLSLTLLARAFNYATSNQPPGGSSGLVEMQRHMAKLRR